MRILKPQKLDLNNLIKVENLVNQIEDNYLIKNKKIENFSKENIEFIKGATINLFQAADLLYLLGVKIK